MAWPPRYGTPNLALIGGWIDRAPADDGTFWAINLMKYRAVADYADGRTTSLSGRDADDAYVPRESLAAIGARIAFAADVERQPAGTPVWDRVGIVRYPSRRAFMDMQRRDDFKRQHVHKDAGMERTIVMACLPLAEPAPRAADPGGTIVIRVLRGTRDAARHVTGITPMAAFTVEGTIIGDERTWDEVRFDVARDAGALDALCAATTADESLVLVARPFIDELVETIVG